MLKKLILVSTSEGAITQLYLGTSPEVEQNNIKGDVSREPNPTLGLFRGIVEGESSKLSGRWYMIRCENHQVCDLPTPMEYFPYTL
jgi:hypothetical protein